MMNVSMKAQAPAKEKPVAQGFRVRLNKNARRQADVDEALNRLESTYFTSDHAEMIKSQKDTKTRFHIISDKIEEQRAISGDKEEKLNEVLFLLENARLNSNDAMELQKRKHRNIVLSLTSGILVLVAAVLLIVLDPPAWLKGPTLLYFNPHDGVTASDVFAILLVGVSTFLMFVGINGLKKR